MIGDKPWVDGPWRVFETPSKTKDVRAHSAIYIADEIANVHNVIIRGMNSIYVQAPYVTELADVEDFLFYVHCWCDLVEQHYSIVGTSLFPAIEELAQRPGLFTSTTQQHRSLTECIHALHDYVQNTDPSKYRASQVRTLVELFGDTLQGHCADEVYHLLMLTDLDSDALMVCWKDADRIRQHLRTEELYPLFFGLADNTFDGSNRSGRYPSVPFYVPWIVHYWTARKHAGAWRFLPCDFWGHPKPLAFAPIESERRSSA